MTNYDQTDVLVIGAGPSGTVAAAKLQQEGVDVQVVEKTEFPRFVIGESLLPKCMEHFEEVGFLDALNKQGYQTKHGARFIRGDKSCLFDFSEQYTQGKTWTWQVPRSHFDKVLADELVARGVPLHFNTAVKAIDIQNGRSTTTVTDPQGRERQINAKFIIDASGWGRVIPRLFGLEEASDMEVRKAFFAHFQDEKRPPGASGKVITFYIHARELWIWVIPFSDGITSVGFVGNPSHFLPYEKEVDLKKRIRQMIAYIPQIADRFENAQFIVEPKIIEAYAAAAKQLYGDGFVLTGNSSEFLDPVFSSGVTFATESGLQAAKLVARQLRGEHVDWEKEYTEYMRQGINTFRTYVNMWYDGRLQDIFFFTSDENSPIDQAHSIKRQICSVLAGYVWDQSNPFVGNRRERALESLSRLVQVYN